MRDGDLNPGVRRRARNSVGQPCRRAVDLRVKIRIGVDRGERRDTGGGRERIPAKRARLIDLADGRHRVHNVAPAAVRADREPAPDNLAERREVRRYAVVLLRAPLGDAKAGHDLVENQHGAGFRGFVAKRLEKFRRAGHAAHVSADRFDNHARYLSAEFCERLSNAGDVVIFDKQRIRSRAGRNAGRVRYGKRRGCAPRGDEKTVDVPVIAADELNDFVPASKPARKSDRAHRRFCTGIDKPNLFD